MTCKPQIPGPLDRPDPLPDHSEGSRTPQAEDAAGGQTAGRSDSDDLLDLEALLRTAFVSMDFDPGTLRKSMDARRRARNTPVDWRLVALPAILVILMVVVESDAART